MHPRDNTFDMQHSSVVISSTSSSGGNRARHNGFPNDISSVDGHTGVIKFWGPHFHYDFGDTSLNLGTPSITLCAR